MHYAVARMLSSRLPFWAVLLITLVFSVAVAVLSYRLIELPARRWRRRRAVPDNLPTQPHLRVDDPDLANRPPYSATVKSPGAEPVTG